MTLILAIIMMMLLLVQPVKNFFKNFFVEEKHLNRYMCEFCLSACIDDDIVKFNLNDCYHAVIHAHDMLDAQHQLAKQIPLSPHVYIHKIKKIDE